MIFDNQVLVPDSPTCIAIAHATFVQDRGTQVHRPHAKTGPQPISSIKASKPSISSLMSAPIGSKILDTPFDFSLPSLPSLPL